MNSKTYALYLLKKKPYFINELYNKLVIKYPKKEVSKLINELVSLDLLNDKKLLKIKLEYLINTKRYGKAYIKEYFSRKNISINLVNYELNKYESNIFEKNKQYIIDELIKKVKNDEYINKYLLRKGYIDD